MTTTPSTKAQHKNATKKDEDGKPDEAPAAASSDEPEQGGLVGVDRYELDPDVDPAGWDVRTHGEPPSARPETDF